VWLDHIEEKKKKLNQENEYELSYFATRSFSDEFGGAIGADISLLNVAIILNLVYANVQLTQWSRVRATATGACLWSSFPEASSVGPRAN
jgi:hypothetical protein